MLIRWPSFLLSCSHYNKAVESSVTVVVRLIDKEGQHHLIQASRQYIIVTPLVWPRPTLLLAYVLAQCVTNVTDEKEFIDVMIACPLRMGRCLSSNLVSSS